MGSKAAAEVVPRNPIVGSFPSCCARRERPHSRTTEQRYEIAASHCPRPPALPTERIAHLGTADCCVHPPGRNEMIAVTPPKIFFQGGSPKTGHPISPPGPPHRQKSFLTKSPGMTPG